MLTSNRGDGTTPIVTPAGALTPTGSAGLGTASFQKLKLEKWAQPLGDLNFTKGIFK